MERLTKRTPSGAAYMAIADTLSKKEQEIEGSKPILEGIYGIFQKLADYEDTGLEPEDVLSSDELREINIKLGQLIDYINLEEQGLLIKLSVKDKTAIYVPDYKRKTVYKTRLEHRNTKIKNGTCEMAIIVPHHMGMLVYFTEKDIGKTVFLTREEAEKALEAPDVN